MLRPYTKHAIPAPVHEGIQSQERGMTEPTNALPAAGPRKVLTQIAAVSWEHPADRAALQSLRSIPGFDQVVKKIYGFIGERGIRLLFQADAVRVGPRQFPRLNELYTDVLTTMDWDPRPDLYVSQTPFVNAGAYGMDRPFIVINSGALKLLDDDEMRTLLGHELGHVMSGHALYVTILIQILNTLERTHPFSTLRAAELQRWIGADQYERILNGEYTRRGPDADNRPIDKDIDEAREHYMKEAKAVVNDVVDSAKRAAQAFTDAFKKR